MTRLPIDQRTGPRTFGADGRSTTRPPTAPDGLDEFHTGLFQPGNGNAMGPYVEEYVYDLVGNF